jgi:hypothetical protein
MRKVILAVVLFATCAPIEGTLAQITPKAAAVEHYSTSTTDIGTLLDDPAAHSIVDKFLPGVFSGERRCIRPPVESA